MSQNSFPDNDQRFQGPGHQPLVQTLQVIGPLIFGVGVLLMVIAFIDFFSAFGGFGPPKLFWMFFLAMPMLAVGGTMTKFGYMGSMARYLSREMAPVQKETFNYLAEGTAPGMQATAKAVTQGVMSVLGGGQEVADLECGSCHARNAHAAKFCNQCGQPIPHEKHCPGCRAANEPTARFCGQCGQSL